MSKYRMDFKLHGLAVYQEVFAPDEMSARAVVLLSHPMAQYLEAKAMVVKAPEAVKPKLVSQANVIDVDFKARKRAI